MKSGKRYAYLAEVMKKAREKARAWSRRYRPVIMHKSYTKIRLGTVYSNEKEP